LVDTRDLKSLVSIEDKPHIPS